MKFFTKNSIGIDIADHTIEVVELSKSGKDVNVESSGRIRLGSGIVERGRIKDEAKLATAIKKMLSKAKPRAIAPERIILGLPEAQVYIHNFVLKPHNKQERDELLLKEAQTNVPVPKSDLVFSHRVLYEGKEGVEIILVATSREVIEEWQKFFQSLKIIIELFDIEQIATFRGLNLEPLKSPICLIDMGAVTTHVSIFDKSGLRYAYAINVAGEQLTQEIAKSLKKSEEESESLKREIGFSKQGDQVFTVLAKVLQPVVTDIKKTFDYFKEQTNESVGEITLVGGSSALKGLADYVSTNLGVPTKIGKQTLFKSNIPLVYIEAIGIALRGIDEKWDKRDPAILPVQGESQSNKVTKSAGKVLSGITRLFKPSKDKPPHQSIGGGGKSPRSDKEKNGNKGPDAKLRIQKLVLLGLLVVGVVVIPASYWYKGYRKAQQEAEVQSRLEAIDAATQKQDNVDAEILNEISESVIIEEKIIITETPIGWLNVREGPGTSYPKVTKVYPGETYTLLEEKDNWYKIKIGEETEGWVTSQYANKK